MTTIWKSKDELLKLYPEKKMETKCWENEIAETETTTPVKTKRDIFRFNGSQTLALNLDHVTNIYLEEKKITFTFYNTANFIELESEDAAKNAFEQILKIWVSEINE